MKIKVLSLFVLLVSFIFFVVSTFVILYESKSRNGDKFSFLRTAAEKNSEHKLEFFPDIFPNRNLVLDLMQLCVDIFGVNKNGRTAQEAISNPKFQYEDWIQPKFSTTCMIVSFEEEGSSRVPVVVFRGSDDLDDYKVDFDIPLEKSKFTNAPSDVKVHRGFQDALFDQDVVQDIEKKILDILGETGENVIVTGHSLG